MLVVIIKLNNDCHACKGTNSPYTIAKTVGANNVITSMVMYSNGEVKMRYDTEHTSSESIIREFKYCPFCGREFRR